MAKLNTFVHVDGKQYGPDDDVPADVAKQITNPDVWDDGDEDATGESAGVRDAEPAAGGESDPNRPKGNASRDVWAAYASRLDPPVRVDASMNRDDIIAAVDKKS